MPKAQARDATRHQMLIGERHRVYHVIPKPFEQRRVHARQFGLDESHIKTDVVTGHDLPLEDFSDPWSDLRERGSVCPHVGMVPVDLQCLGHRVFDALGTYTGVQQSRTILSENGDLDNFMLARIEARSLGVEEAQLLLLKRHIPQTLPRQRLFRKTFFEFPEYKGDPWCLGGIMATVPSRLRTYLSKSRHHVHDVIVEATNTDLRGPAGDLYYHTMDLITHEKLHENTDGVLALLRGDEHDVKAYMLDRYLQEMREVN